MVKCLCVLCWIILCGPSKVSAQLSLKVLPDTVAKKISLAVIPANFYTQHMGFMCKKEALLQKKTTLHLFIRLGTKDYVDYMERKPNAVKPVQ